MQSLEKFSAARSGENIKVVQKNERLFELTPHDLMLEAKEGNADAFGLLYKRYFVPVFRYVYFRVRHKECSEDLVQTVFLKAYQSVKRFEYQGKEPLAYFYTIARTTVLDHWKKKKELPLDDETIARSLQSNSDVAQKIDMASDLARIMEVVPGLSVDQQDVITLKFINDFDTRQIARMMEKEEATVRQIQSRALKAIREKLQ